MNKLSKIANDYLFAPARYLHSDGAIVDAGRIRDAISSPDVKVGVLTAVALGIAFTAAGQGDIGKILPCASAGLIISRLISSRKEQNSSGPAYYFDTRPGRKMPIPSADIELDLSQKKETARILSVTATPLTVALITAVDYYVTKDFAVSAAIGGTLGATHLTHYAAMWWRANEAQKGNWNVLSREPRPPQAQTEAETETSLAPQGTSRLAL